MVQLERPPVNTLNRLARKVYNPIGFTRFYNFVLWFIFSGALFGFILSRSGYVSYGIFCGGDPTYGGAPGECLTYNSQERYKVGIILHLVTIVPASILVLVQFIPAVRHKAIIIHRMNGYIVIVLTLATFAGALMIARHAFGGAVATQLWVGIVASVVIFSYVLAYYNVKRLQIDQHRKWMLRAWFYMGSIVTQRLIFLAMPKVISHIGSYWEAMECERIEALSNTFGIPPQALPGFYPGCINYFNGSDPHQWTAVRANTYGRPEQATAALDASFPASLWTAVIIHAIGIEIYLHLTPREHERLRQVSYERQIEKGLSHAGSSGFTSDRYGDSAPWVPEGKRAMSTEGLLESKKVSPVHESPDSHRMLDGESNRR